MSHVLVINQHKQPQPPVHPAQAKQPLKDAAAVNTTRWALYERMQATGHGTRQMCRMDKYGFPRTGPKAARIVKGFRTGDLVRAVVPHGAKVGTYVGRVAVRASGRFNLTTGTATVQGISFRFCRLLHHSDGFTYHTGGGIHLHA